jgi:hypothetical protein
MCFTFSSKPSTKAGHVSIIVLAGMNFVAKTPRPYGDR